MDVTTVSSVQPLRSPLGVLCESSADICHVIVDFLGATRSAIQLACASRAWYEHVCSADVWEAYAQLRMPHCELSLGQNICRLTSKEMILTKRKITLHLFFDFSRGVACRLSVSHECQWYELPAATVQSSWGAV